MSNEMVFDIGQTGRVTGMHHDKMDMGFLGKQKITRASDIRFDTSKQQWFIHLASPSHRQRFIKSETVGGFSGYNEARDFEVLWLNECLKAKVSPLSIDGGDIGSRLYGKATGGAGVAHD